MNPRLSEATATGAGHMLRHKLRLRLAGAALCASASLQRQRVGGESTAPSAPSAWYS